jgi:DNA-binding GntR family transcriptional regulator
LPPRPAPPFAAEEAIQPGVKRSTVEYIVQDIEQAIQSGRLAAGQRLVEPDLMRELDVSRGSLREALNRLAATGLIQIIPNRGAVVRRLTRKEVADRFQIRERLEGLAAALAAQHLDGGDNRARLQSAAHRTGGQGHSIAEYRRENYVLHGTIAEISGNPQLVSMIRSLWLPTVMVELRNSLDDAYWRASSEDHLRIVEAILAQDAAAAERAMTDHLRSQCEVILALPSRVFGE